MIATSNLALRFVLELAGLAALAYAGFQSFDDPVRWLTAVAVPLALAGFWAFVVAPNATNGLRPGVREILGSIALLCAAGALAASGEPRPAVLFAGLTVANHVLLAVLGDKAMEAEGSR